MAETLMWLAVGVPAVLLAGSLYWLNRVRRREALYRWAATNGYRLLDYKQPLLTELSGFPFTVSKAQAIFWVEVETSTGRQNGWVRLGSFWLGLWSEVAEVRWQPTR